LIVALGAGLPVPYALHLPGDSASYVAIDIVVWPVIAGALVLTSPREWRGLQRDTVTRLLIAFVAVAAISVPFGFLAYHALSGPVSFAYQVVILLNFVIGYWALREVADIELLVRGFVISAGVIALLLSLYLLYAGGLEKVHVIHNSPALRSFIYGWPNGFAVLLDVAFVMCLYFIQTASSRVPRVLYLLVATGLGACIALTFSKTGWVALLVALWLLFLRFWSVRRQLLLLGSLLSGIAILSALNESFRKQVFTLDTLAERVRFLGVVLHDLNPITLLAGSGSLNVETLLAGHANEQLIPGVTVGSLSTHDEFLTVLVKTGLIGLVLFVAILIVVVWRARVVAKTAQGRTAVFFRYWFAASCAVVASLFAGEELHYWLVSALFWLMAGATVHQLPEVVTEPLDAQHFVKRVIDVVAGAIALVVASPVLIAAAILVKLDSPGPAIYPGPRAGRGGRVFTMYKLRTMRVGADSAGSVTVAGDARVTRVGRVLRKLKLDELPQLVNVVKGDMSLVGPRPDTPDYVKLYDQRQRGVLRVRPGITSPASIAFHNEEELLVAAAADGRRTPADIYREEIMPRELELDLEYVEHWSLLRDLKILLETLGLFLRRLFGLPGDLRHPDRSRLPAPQPKVDQTLEKADPIADVIAGEGQRQDR
jgi:lipopolysaccharide/colanic/teichoic acid biosynthesis glycosyltransferase